MRQGENAFLPSQFLEKWLGWAGKSKLAPLCKFAKMVRDHQRGILAYFSTPLANGKVEAMNNNAKQISYRAQGSEPSQPSLITSITVSGSYRCRRWCTIRMSSRKRRKNGITGKKDRACRVPTCR
jgi:hypothetical protein